MENEDYGIIQEIQEQPKFPIRTLLRVPHKEKPLVVSRNAFGRNTLSRNEKEMRKNYCYPNSHKVITFRPATTSESVSASVYDFKKLAKQDIFDPSWLQAGKIVRTSKGVFVNTQEMDESKLTKLLNQCKQINGIWLYQGEDPKLRDFGFAPYETFEQDTEQPAENFAKSGLARVLEHTEAEVAENLKAIASTYPRGVYVWGFNKVSTPVQSVAVLFSSWGIGGGGLGVGGDGWVGYGGGCAFGVLCEGNEVA